VQGVQRVQRGRRGAVGGVTDGVTDGVTLVLLPSVCLVFGGYRVSTRGIRVSCRTLNMCVSGGEQMSVMGHVKVQRESRTGSCQNEHRK